MKDAITIRAELAKPFAPEDLEWRLQVTTKDKTRGMAVPYVTNRAIQDRLDEVVGPDNWYNQFRPWHSSGKKDAQICGIAIYFEEKQNFVTKWDGAENSDIEPVKGGLSDSMKRAAVQWGIGRVLYKMDAVWVEVEQQGASYGIRKSERGKLDKAYLDMLARLNLTPAQPGGLQSQLTPRQEMTASAEKKPPEEEKARRTETVPPEPEYTVEAVRQQIGMNGQRSLSLTLLDQAQKTVRAYARGEHAALVPGARLCQVKLERVQQDTVIFYLLREYRVIEDSGRAA